MNRNFGLDAMRAFSIWLVLVQHGGYNIPGMEPLKIGAVGVEIFFVLSGFLIGGILFRELDKRQSFGKTLKRFWVRRWYRILPLYYLAITVKFVFFQPEIGWNVLYYYFFLQNNFYGVQFYGVTWSLVIEEWFYLAAPIYLFVVSRLAQNKQQLLAWIGLFIAGVVGMRLAYVLITDVGFNGINGNFPFRFDSLFLGVGVAYLRHAKFRLYERLQSIWAFVLGAGIFLGYLTYYWFMANPVNHINEMLFPRVAGFFILPLGIAISVPYIASFRDYNIRNFADRMWFQFITYTSLYTYAIYLIHTLVYKWTMKPDFYIKVHVLQLLIGIAITYAIAALVYNFFEKPILDFRDKLVKR